MFLVYKIFFQHTKHFLIILLLTQKNEMDDGLVRAIIQLNSSRNNTMGCDRCPLALLKSIFNRTCGVQSIIPYQRLTNENGDLTFSSPWDSKVYQSYSMSVKDGHVILIDFYSDGATLAGSGTQSATFLRIRFSNIKRYSETLFTVGIAPT